MSHGNHCPLSGDCMQEDGHTGACTPVEAPKAATGGLWRYHGHGGKYRITRAKDGTSPEWPAFVLAASDPAAPGALQAYALAAHQFGMDPQYVADVQRLAGEFAAWRTEHGTGKPDALPEEEAPEAPPVPAPARCPLWPDCSREPGHRGPCVEGPFVVPPGLEAMALRIAGVDLADKPDGIALAPPALDALFRRHEEVYNNDGDATVESVLAACALEAFALGAVHAGHGTPAEEAERAVVLREVRNTGYDEGFASGREQGRRDERARIVALLADLRDDMRRRAISARAEANKHKALTREARQVEQSYLSAAGGLVEAATRLGDGEAV